MFKLKRLATTTTTQAGQLATRKEKKREAHQETCLSVWSDKDARQPSSTENSTKQETDERKKTREGGENGRAQILLLGYYLNREDGGKT